MKAKTKKNVLIITPPPASPAMPSFAAAFLAGCMSHSGIRPKHYDAALDFTADQIFSKNYLRHYFQTAARKKEQGLIPPDTFRMLEKKFKKISAQPFSTDSFKSDLFYDPVTYLAALNHVEDLFLLYSYAGYPAPLRSQVRWNPFQCNVNKDIDSAIFISFCREKLEAMINQVDPAVVILALDSETQVCASNIIFSHIKTIFPGIETIVLQDKRFPAENTPCAVQAFCLQDLPPFFQWINTTWNLRQQYINVEPDFSIFSLKDYLTPEVILPIKPSVFKDAASLWQTVSRLMARYGAAGFLFMDPVESLDFFFKKKKDLNPFLGIQAVMADPGMTDPTMIGSENDTQALSTTGIALIQWEAPEKKDALAAKMLWQSSRQGIWNHIKLKASADRSISDDLLRFISVNPNIAHSFEIEEFPADDDDGEPDSNQIEPSRQPYSIVTPLPGEPFWRALSDPVHLLLYLKQYGKKNLFCLRSDRKKQIVLSLGSDIRFYFKKPDDLPPGYFDEICRMVEAGGSVDLKYVRYNLERAFLIGYAEENGLIIGNSSLKHPRKQFVQRLNNITGLSFQHFVERGYTSVRPEYRALGVGARLLDGLTKRAGQYKVFSIISEDNIATHKIAIKNKTKKIAVYYSEKAGKDLGIWMPEKMIDKEWKLNL